MKKIKQEAKHPNDVPVIFLTDPTGKVVRKISINEWRALKANPDQIEELDIKLYREAISFYLQEDYAKAKDLLHFLINKTDYSHYEYVERLANIYRIENRPAKEKDLLLTAYHAIKPLDSSEGILRRIENRLQKIDAFDFPTSTQFSH